MAKFLAVNWRDLRNPDAGGAEVHLHEILTRLAAKGHEVTLLTTGYAGARSEEEYDGMRVLRRGSWYNANFVLARYARSWLKNNPVDLVIEDINKIPFFLPAWVKARVLPVVPHLFGATVFRETNFLFAGYVYLWERLIPRVFRNCRFAVISPSTREDLVRRGIDEKKIDVVLCGLDHKTYRRLDGVTRYETPTIVHFGRMRKYKSIDVVIEAFARIRRELPDAKLLIVGDGPARANLVKLVARLQLGESVEFTGVISTQDLVEVLNRCHLFLNASPKEGWGLTVVEANACGLPVVASDRPGLRDSVLNGRTGYLVAYGDAQAFAARALELLGNRETWEQMSAAGTEWARSLTWEKTAAEMEEIFLREMD